MKAALIASFKPHIENKSRDSNKRHISVISTAAQRAEIRNLASALSAQNEELERLKDDLTEISRVPVHPQYFHLPG